MNNQQLEVLEKSDLFAVSPDGRYLAIGKQNIRVWDLQGLLPNLRYSAPIHRQTIIHNPIAVMRFVDNQRIQVIDVNGNLQYWDIASGEEVTLQ
jgi:WD40 repeat protein